MKQFLSFFLSIIVYTCCTMAQTSLPYKTPDDIVSCLIEVGKDTLPTLNECESRCLNYEFQNRKGAFDFTGKKAVFFRGNWGQILVSKKWYFDHLKSSYNILGYIEYEHIDTIWLYIFSEEEAKQVGYDVAIFSGCKKAPLSKKEIISRLTN